MYIDVKNTSKICSYVVTHGYPRASYSAIVWCLTEHSQIIFCRSKH